MSSQKDDGLEHTIKQKSDGLKQIQQEIVDLI